MVRAPLRVKEACSLASGSWTSSTVQALRRGRMAHVTMGALKKASKKAKANIFSSTELTIKEHGLIT
jgi:hypothetical protein